MRVQQPWILVDMVVNLDLGFLLQGGTEWFYQTRLWKGTVCFGEAVVNVKSGSSVI